MTAPLTVLTLRYLPNAAGEGLIFRLGQFLERTDDRQASDRLRSFFGDFLEAYVTDLLHDALSHRNYKLFRENVFGKREERTSDTAIFDGEEAIFVDVNAKRFNVTHSVLSLDLGSIKRDLEKMIITKLNKIAKRARDFRAGRFVYDGIVSDVNKTRYWVGDNSARSFAGCWRHLKRSTGIGAESA